MSIDVDPARRRGLGRGPPVVALESTLLCHGIPAPRNRELAAEIEDAVRAAGAVPATVAVIDGRIKAGLTRGGAGAAAGCARGRQVLDPRPAPDPRERRARRDDHRGDRVRGGAGRHPDHGDRRPWRRASGRGTNPRRLGRSRGAGAHAGDRGVQRHQVDPGSGAHPRAPGDAGRAGGRLSAATSCPASTRRRPGCACRGSTNSTTCAGCTRRTERSGSRAWSSFSPRPSAAPCRGRRSSAWSKGPVRRRAPEGSAARPTRRSCCSTWRSTAGARRCG